MRKLIDAVDLMAKATMSNEPLHQSTFMDVDQNSHKRKSFCDTDESIQSDPKVRTKQGRRHGVDLGGHVHPTFLRSVFIPKKKRYQKH